MGLYMRELVNGRGGGVNMGFTVLGMTPFCEPHSTQAEFQRGGGTVAFSTLKANLHTRN